MTEEGYWKAGYFGGGRDERGFVFIFHHQLRGLKGDYTLLARVQPSPDEKLAQQLGKTKT